MKASASISQAKPMPASGRGNSLELALEISELRYRRLFETAQDGILILDRTVREQRKGALRALREGGNYSPPAELDEADGGFHEPRTDA